MDNYRITFVGITLWTKKPIWSWRYVFYEATLDRCIIFFSNEDQALNDYKDWNNCSTALERSEFVKIMVEDFGERIREFLDKYRYLKQKLPYAKGIKLEASITYEHHNVSSLRSTIFFINDPTKVWQGKRILDSYLDNGYKKLGKKYYDFLEKVIYL